MELVAPVAGNVLEDTELLDQLARCSCDLRYCGKMLFSETFEAPYSSLHNQIFDLIDAALLGRNSGLCIKVGIQAPRGIGKSSIASLVIQQAILFRLAHFCVYIHSSATLAEMQTENIKRELLTNREVRRLFGNVKISDHGEAGLDETFSKAAWVAYGRTLVLPRGSGQRIRGLNWSGYRPQIIVIDDLEDKKEVRNPEIRKEQKQWVLSDVLKSTNKYKKDWCVIYIDTLKHEDSVMQMILDSSDWTTVSLSICDGNYKSYDTNYMTDDEIQAEVAAHREKGELDVFYMEYMGVPISSEDSAFKSEYFKYYDEAELKDNKDIETVVIGDPAKTVKMHSAESAVVAWGIDRRTNRLYVRDVVHRKMFPDEFYDEIFSMCDRMGAHVAGVETTSLEEFIKQPLINEMNRRGRFVEWVWLKARGGSTRQTGKEMRISSLVPFYRQGYIFHNPSCCGELEQQLLSFPRSRLWDIMDAAAYIVEMLELGERYFQPPEEYENPEDEYKELEDSYEPAVDDWRLI